MNNKLVIQPIITPCIFLTLSFHKTPLNMCNDGDYFVDQRVAKT